MKYSNAIVLLTGAINNALSMLQSLDESIECYQFCIPFKVENELLEKKELEENRDNVQRIFDSLEDKLSKDIFVANINYKLTGNMLPLVDMITGDNFNLVYFNDDLFDAERKHTYVDIGAYTGDSIMSFLMATRGVYKKIIAYEGDTGNYNALLKFRTYIGLSQINIINSILWSKREKKSIYTFSNNSEINFDSPNLFTEVGNIADKKTLRETKKEQIVSQEIHVDTDTLDNQLENEIPTLIKINAMAADFEILKGGRNILSKYKPMLILEYGVKIDDMFKLILWIKEINPEYKFYMREKRIYNDIKAVLYAK